MVGVLITAALTGLALLAASSRATAQPAARAAAPTRRRTPRKRARAPRPRRAAPAPTRPKLPPAKRPPKPKPATRAAIPTHKVAVTSSTAAAPGLSPREAAQELYKYAGALIRAGKASMLGTKTQRNKRVRGWQATMGRIAADGIYSTKTRRRGKELIGKSFPIRLRVTRPAPPAPPRPEERLFVSTARVSRPASTPEPEPRPEPPPEALPEPQAQAQPEPTPEDDTQGRTAEQAAQDLWDYVATIGSKGRARKLGYKLKPNARIKADQLDMGFTGKNADGIYGPATRRRGRELIDRSFPAR